MKTYCLVVLSISMLLGCSPQEPPAEVDASSAAPAQTVAPVEPAAAEGPTREITNISGDLYRARNNNHYTIFLVTPDGTILGDPINVGFAEWLKNELADRFDSTVRYVLYSHHHWDHASGGEVFADTAEFVSHENMATALEAELPGNQAPNDANGDGSLQRDETTGGTLAQFDVIDADGDGNLTGMEFNANIRAPGFTYSDSNLIMLGGKQVHMIHPPMNHSDDASILYFPAERTAFAVDYINIKRLPGGIATASLEDWEAAINMIAELDVDTIVPGHGDMGTPEDLADYWQYFQDLHDAVAAGIADGKTVEQLQESVSLEDYQDWGRYETQLPNNVTDMVSLLSTETE